MGSDISYPSENIYHYIEQLKTEYLALAPSIYAKVCAEKEFSLLLNLAEKNTKLSQYHPIYYIDKTYERNIYYALIDVLSYIIAEYMMLMTDVVVIDTGNHDDQFKTIYNRIQKKLEFIKIGKRYIPILTNSTLNKSIMNNIHLLFRDSSKKILVSEKNNQPNPTEIKSNPMRLQAMSVKLTPK
jgi:hypothetical protein